MEASFDSDIVCVLLQFIEKEQGSPYKTCCFYCDLCLVSRQMHDFCASQPVFRRVLKSIWVGYLEKCNYWPKNDAIHGYHTYEVFKYAPAHLRGDVDVILNSASPVDSFEYALDKLKDDREFVTTILKIGAAAIEHVVEQQLSILAKYRRRRPRSGAGWHCLPTWECPAPSTAS